MKNIHFINSKAAQHGSYLLAYCPICGKIPNGLYEKTNNGYLCNFCGYIGNRYSFKIKLITQYEK